MRIVKKFAAIGGHRNIVTILCHGWLEANHIYYFDMERCVLTLESFIRHKFCEKLGLKQYFSLSIESEPLSIVSMWSIIIHITSGVNFIHHLGEIHRDLKPSNGNVAGIGR